MLSSLRTNLYTVHKGNISGGYCYKRIVVGGKIKNITNEYDIDTIMYT